ncbi:hypothetical protein AVEN_3217-1 [Araneus ventricosus]|uniref:Uncharacterized protein n=1 Tax=Araneus ventricosus TaxID=182803 RepID=A0A4Y2G8R4_ARAVE|nr:hypothetical protein AVEN_3217-1 [Araneus ventricosus]
MSKFSLVTLTSSSEETRGLLRLTISFEPWSDDRGRTYDGTLSKLPSHTSGRTFGHCVACNGRHTRQIFWRIGFRFWSPLALKLKPYR